MIYLQYNEIDCILFFVNASITKIKRQFLKEPTITLYFWVAIWNFGNTDYELKTFCLVSVLVSQQNEMSWHLYLLYQNKHLLQYLYV